MRQGLSERAVSALRFLFPTDSLRPDGATWLVDQLIDAELHRRGAPDQVSGAYHALALREGTLLKEEYDLGTHGHADAWTLGAVVADALELTVYNMHHGFPAGDAALAAMVRGMKAACPRGKVVRLHTDAFAVLLGPTAEQPVDASLVGRVREAMAVEVQAAGRGAGLGFTMGALELTVTDPPSHQVLGPLVWAECERALVVAKRAKTSDVQRRRFDLKGRLPAFPE